MESASQWLLLVLSVLLIAYPLQPYPYNVRVGIFLIIGLPGLVFLLVIAYAMAAPSFQVLKQKLSVVRGTITGRGAEQPRGTTQSRQATGTEMTQTSDANKDRDTNKGGALSPL